MMLRALTPVRLSIDPGGAMLRWRVTGPEHDPVLLHLASTQQPSTATRTGEPVEVIVLGRSWTGRSTEAVLAAVSGARHARRLVLVHSGAGGGSLLRSLAAEVPGLSAGTIEITDPTAAALTALTRLLGHAGDEVTVDAAGQVSRTGWLPVRLPSGPRFGPGAEVLITGGLGGLGIRMAALLADAGAVPTLVDARDPAEAPADSRRYLAALRRLAPKATVLRLDLTDPASTTGSLAGLQPQAVVHCAGRVAGGTGRVLTAGEVDLLVAAKVVSLRQVMAAVDPCRLRAVLAFGSVTAYGAHPGLAGYALANELLRREVDRLAGAFPATAWCTAEWSVWSGAGMARRAARTAARSLGMVPVPVAPGIRAAGDLLSALADPDRAEIPRSLLVTGARAGSRPEAGGGSSDTGGAGSNGQRWYAGVPGIDATLVRDPEPG